MVTTQAWHLVFFIYYFFLTFALCTCSMHEVSCTLITLEWDIDRHWGFNALQTMPWSTLASFLGIHTHLVHLEKPEMLRVSEVKDTLHDECELIEECFGKRGESKDLWKKLTVHHCFLLGSQFCHKCVQNFPVVIVISPSCYFLLLPHLLCLLKHLSLWSVLSAQLVLVQCFYLYSTVSAACHRTAVWRRNAPSFFPPAPVLITQHTSVTVIYISHKYGGSERSMHCNFREFMQVDQVVTI